MPSIGPDATCARRFTKSGLSCVNCGSVAQGCFEALDVVYCVKGGCSDPACDAHTPSNPIDYNAPAPHHP